MIRAVLDKVKQDGVNRSSLINLMLKPVSMILGLIYTPILLEYLGDTKYGLWSTILSIISWVNYCDIGIGHGLRNLLTSELTNKKMEQVKRTVSTAYAVLSIISVGLLVVSLFCVWKLDWYGIFNTDIDMRFPMGISFSFICVNFVLSLSNYILYALQLSERVAILNCLTQIMNILGILVLRQVSQGSLVWVSILFGVTSLIVYVVNTVQIFRKNKCLMPSRKCFAKEKVREISNTGVKFFIIQLACMALYTVDNLLITNLFGANAVTPFNMVYRIFNTCYAFVTAFCVPYWSKTTQAYERGDIRWLRKSMKQLNLFAGMSIVGFIVLAVVFRPIAYIWLGRSLDYPDGLIFVMCIYYCLYTIVTVKVQMINGTGKINFQLGLMSFMGIVNVPLSIFLAKTCELGVVGVRLATTLLMAIAAIAFPINLRMIVKKIEREEKIRKDGVNGGL